MTNNSWGGDGFSQAIYDAVQAQGEAGMLFVAAAGNSHRDVDLQPAYPAAFDLDTSGGAAEILWRPKPR